MKINICWTFLAQFLLLFISSVDPLKHNIICLGFLSVVLVFFIFLQFYTRCSLLYHASNVICNIRHQNKDYLWAGHTLNYCLSTVATIPRHPIKTTKVQTRQLSNLTPGESAPLQGVKQPVTLESFDHQEAFKILPLLDKLSLIISVALILL